MSAHVWYRGALTQLHHGETLVEKTAHVPEQASFGNVASANDEKNHNHNTNDKSSSSSSSGGSDRKETFFQDKHDDSTHHHHHVTTMNAPEKTALASISMEEEEEMIVNPHSKFQQEMTIFSWDWACSFLPMSFSSSTEQVEMMTAAPETALGSIPLSELVTNHDMNTMEPTAILHHHTNDEYEDVSKMTNPFNTNDTLWVLHQPESALGVICVKEMLVDDDDDDIPTTSTTNNALPRTLQEYYEIASQDERAMVVTRVQSPHAIVDVNDAWVGLCGYTRGQAIDKSLGELLQGEETITLNPDFMKRLQQGKEASTVLVNYDANGRKFINRVHAGPLKNENDVVTHFVGVLQELKQHA